jgi:dienelactone hydrolase
MYESKLRNRSKLSLIVCCLCLRQIQSFTLFTKDSTNTRFSPCSLAMSSSNNNKNDWSPLNPESLVSAKCLIEQTLCSPSDGRPRLAKSVDYATAIFDAWQDELQDKPALDDNDNFLHHDDVEYKPVAYQDSDGKSLHGYLVRMRRKDDENETPTSNSPSPVVLFFHTASGPHDLFLLYKAFSLIHSPQLSSFHCQVLIADILGDDAGWAWSENRERYIATRDYVLKKSHDNNDRPVLQRRIQAALSFLSCQDGLDTTRLAAFGWCLGGHVILELARMRVPNMRAMATFHGVFTDDHNSDDDAAATATSSYDEITSADQPAAAEVLLCHGIHDPFVSDQQLASAMATFQNLQCRLSLLQLPAKHGFTNPAQVYSENSTAFAYHQEAADKAWRQALAMLQRNLA